MNDYSRGDTCNIWVAKLESVSAITRFIREPYKINGVTTSRFAHSLKVKFKADDVLYMQRGKDLNELMRLVPYQFYYLVKKQIEEKELTDIDTLICHNGVVLSTLSEISKPPVWHVGQFDITQLDALNNEYTRHSIATDFWTDYPQTEPELLALKNAATNSADIEFTVKYAVMLLCGIGYPEEIWQARNLLRDCGAPKAMLQEALHAIGSDGHGHGSAWFQLFLLNHTIRNRNYSEDSPESRSYLEKAIDLGSDDAMCRVSDFLTTRILNIGYDLDYKRAEKIMLERWDAGRTSVANSLMKLYSNGPLKKGAKAVHWAKVSILNDAHFSGFVCLADHYLEGDGVDKDLSAYVMYRYLSLCNSPWEEDYTSKIVGKISKKLDQCSLEDLETGRQMAKDWIAENTSKLPGFKEIRDPFESYIKQR